MAWKVVLEFLVLLAAIGLGARTGGVGFGAWGGVGLTVMVFLFGMSPGQIPIDVLFIIMCVVVAAAVMEAAGGLEYLVSLAERVIRAHPEHITIVAPLVTWTLTFLAGTGHVVYPILPVIEEVALEHKVRVERPMAIAAIASQQSITASPVSAATAAMIGLLSSRGVGLGQILLTCVPATLAGVIVAALIQMRVGKELEQDPEYLRRVATGEILPRSSEETHRGEVTSNAKRSVGFFLAGVALVVIAGLFPQLRPIVTVNAKHGPLPMPITIELVMLTAAAVMMAVTRVKSDAPIKSSVAHAGLTAVIAILGLSWMGNTFIENNQNMIVGAISSLAKQYPPLFALGLFVASIFLYSQAATTALLMPLGLSLGIHPALLVGMFPAVNGYFFIPNYGTMIAAVNFDRTGTTHIGRWVLNHSFMLPGLLATLVAVLVGLGISQFFM